MKIKVQILGDTLNIEGVEELSAANANSFRDQVRGALAERSKNIDVDLSRTMFLDSCGLGALISLHKTACTRNGAVRLLNPTAPVEQILELTRLQRGESRVARQRPHGGFRLAGARPAAGF